MEAGELDHGEHLKQRILVRGQTVGQRRDVHDTVPASLNSGRWRSCLPTATAKEINVGGNVEISNEPDMESLAADGAGAQVHLANSAEYGGRRLAPAFRLTRSFLEVPWKLR